MDKWNEFLNSIAGVHDVRTANQWLKRYNKNTLKFGRQKTKKNGEEYALYVIIEGTRRIKIKSSPYLVDVLEYAYNCI